jgi:hypothetical protein
LDEEFVIDHVVREVDVALVEVVEVVEYRCEVGSELLLEVIVA